MRLKKLITTLVLGVSSLLSFGQKYDNPGNYGVELNRLRTVNAFHPPFASIGDSVKDVATNRKKGAFAYDSTNKKYIYSSNGYIYDSVAMGGGTIQNLQNVLNAGNSAIGKTINLSTNTSIDSFGIHLTGHGRSVGMDIYNPDDTSTDGKLNVAHLRIRNSSGKGWDLRTYAPVYTGFAVLFSDADSAFGMQGNGYNDWITWRSVGHGFDPYMVDYHNTANLNISSDYIDHMLYSNHDHNFYVKGNAKFNNPLTLNDTGRGNAYLYMGNYLDNPNFVQAVGLRIVTKKSDSSQLLATELTGNGDYYVAKRACVGSTLNSDTLMAQFNIRKPDLTTFPLMNLDRNSANANFIEFWRYFKTKIGYIDPSGYVFMPRFYATAPTKTAAATVVDSIVRYNTSTQEFEVAKFFSYGSSTQSGNSSTTVFNIAHGLGVTPTFWNVTPASSAAVGSFYVTADATNLIITYSVAPASGTNNLIFKYLAK